MQRKNGILKHNAMAMIMAIAVIVVIGTILALSIAMTAQTTKRTNDLYLYEQSVLMSKSATEYALLQIAESNPCTDLNTTFVQDTIYTIDINMQYIYYDDPTTALIDEAQAVCNAIPLANRGTLYTTVTTPEQNGSVLMDVTVTVPDNISITSEPIRYFRRTIQKL
jgi:hypothetical protein